MTLPLFSRVILTQDIRTHNLVVGHMGPLLSIILPPTSIPKDMRWSVLPATVKTIAVVSVPTTALRQATSKDVMHVRQLTPSSS